MSAHEELTRDQLTRLSALANRQLAIEAELAELAARVKDLERQHRQLSEVDLPGVLDETGLSEVRLADGTKVVVREDLRVSTTGKYRDVINAWLEETGHDDLVRDEVTAEFGKGRGDVAEQALRQLLELTSTVGRKRYVNPQTFGALLRELLAAGEDVPLEKLGAFVQRRVKLDRS